MRTSLVDVDSQSSLAKMEIKSFNVVTTKYNECETADGQRQREQCVKKETVRSANWTLFTHKHIPHTQVCAPKNDRITYRTNGKR